MRTLILFFLLASSLGFAKDRTLMAITVDDLPAHGNLPIGVTRLDVVKQMLAVLKKHKVPEVYGFINGKDMEKEPKLIQILEEWRKAEYPLGNHTYSHTDLNKASPEEFTREIEKDELILKKLNGNMDWRYFRYPYLHEGIDLTKRNEVRKFLSDNHYVIAQVTIDFEDWSWNEPYARCKDKEDEKSIDWLRSSYIHDALFHLEQDKKISQALFKKQIPQIMLLHIGAFDAEMIDQLLNEFEKQDVQFIPLSQALKDEVYSINPAVEEKAAAEFQYQVLKSRNITLDSLGIKSHRLDTRDKLDKLCK